MTSGVSAFGTKLQREGVAIAEIVGISGPGLAADTIDMASHDSETGYRDFKGGLRDGGEITFDLIFVRPTGSSVTMEADDDKVTFVTGTPPVNGTPVSFVGGVPVDLAVDRVYFVRDVSGATCKVAATLGGDAIGLTADSVGTVTAYPMDASGNNLLLDFSSGAVKSYSLVFPDAATTTWTIPCIVTGFEVSAPIDDKLSAAVTLKVSGKPTLV